jgi:hypothetical protein
VGLRVKYLQFIENCVEKANLDGDNLTIVELGNQHMRNSDNMLSFYKEKGIKKPKRTGKEYFQACGYDHTSIDLNGSDKALREDLSKEIKNKKLLNNFDVLTNCGTSEHVKNQYECFKNCHNLCNENSVMIHIVPQLGSWKKHGDFFYRNQFFEILAKYCHYEIIDNTVIGKPPTALVSVGLKKTKNAEFVSKEKFQELFTKNESKSS